MMDVVCSNVRVFSEKLFTIRLLYILVDAFRWDIPNVSYYIICPLSSVPLLGAENHVDLSCFHEIPFNDHAIPDTGATSSLRSHDPDLNYLNEYIILILCYM